MRRMGRHHAAELPSCGRLAEWPRGAGARWVSPVSRMDGRPAPDPARLGSRETYPGRRGAGQRGRRSRGRVVSIPRAPGRHRSVAPMAPVTVTVRSADEVRAAIATYMLGENVRA